MASRINIVIIEPSIIIRKGLIAILERVTSLKINLLELLDIEDNLDKITNFIPNVVIVNPLHLSADIAKQIRENVANFITVNSENDSLPSEIPAYSGIKIIALLTSLADPTALKNYNGSISIYDNVDRIKEVLTEAVKEKGEEPAKNVLSAREKEIIVCVVKGMTNKQIADHLILSTHTVIAHRRNIASKLQIHSSAGLTIYAIVNNLVDISEISAE